MGIGHNIKLQRVKNNLTQKELAEKLHISYQAVSKWEKDETEPSFDTIKEMTKIFNCTIDDLFGIETEKEEEKPIEVVVEDPKEEVKEVILDRIEVSYKNINQNTIIAVYSKFNWKLVNKISNINLNITKYVFERENTLDNKILDYEAYLVKKYYEIDAQRVLPNMLIVSSTFIIILSILAWIFGDNTSTMVLFVVSIAMLFIPFGISIFVLIKNLLSKKLKMKDLNALVSKFVQNVNMGYKDIDYFIKELISRKISVMDLSIYRFM